mgnify:CR=1 FL=1
MGKSLGEYNIKKSSSTDTRNIQWSRKKSISTGQSKKKKTGKKNPNSSPTNIIYDKNTKKIEVKIEKVFKVVNEENPEKSSNKNPGKMHQESSAKNSKIQAGHKRPGR